jgi:hypothetical protein
MRSDTPRDRAADLAPWVGGIVLAIPVLLCSYPPMSDLPLHEASIGLLRHWGDAKFAPPSLYFVNLGQANQLFSILVYLVSFAVPIGWASKIVVASALVGLPVAAARFADHVGAPRWTALLVAPVGLGWLFFWGLIQNIVGLVALLALLPSIDRFAAKPTTRGALGMCAAMVLLHFAHQAMQLVALMALVLCSAGATLRDARGIALRLAPVLLCALLVFIANRMAWRYAGPMHKAMQPFQWTEVSYKLAEIPGVLFAGYEPYVRNLMMLLVSVPLVFFGIGRLRSRPRDLDGWGARVHEWRFELLALALFILFVVAPSTVKSTTLVYHRFLPPAWSVLAVAGAARTARVARLVPRALCATAPIASILTSWPTFVDSHHVYADLEALLPNVEVGSSVAALNLGPNPPNRLWDPMVAAGHIVAVKGGRSLFDYTQSPVSPVTQKGNRTWLEPLVRLESKPWDFRPAWDFTRFRYVFMATPKPSRALAVIYCLRDEARLVASQGDWYLFESKLPVVPVDSKDAWPPDPPPPTLLQKLKAAAIELEAEEATEASAQIGRPPPP